MIIKRFISKLLDSNVYILEKDNEILIIDSGVEVKDVEKVIGNKKVVGLLLTHGHFDHSAYCLDYAKAFNTKIYASDKIKDTLTDKKAIYSENGEIIDDFSNFEFISGDKKLKLGKFDIECYYAPGHSKCCECYLIEGQLFAGDVLFRRSIGRTDLVSSSRDEMYDTLIKLEKVEFENVYSGHDDSSSHEEQLKNFAIYKRFLRR